MTAHAPGDMREDRVAVVELDRKCRTRKDLFDAADYLKRALFDRLRGIMGFRLALTGFADSTASGY